MIEILDSFNNIVRQINRVEFTESLEILDFVNQIVMKVKAFQLFLVVQIRYFSDTVVLQPQGFEARVFDEVLDEGETLKTIIYSTIICRRIIIFFFTDLCNANTKHRSGEEFDTDALFCNDPLSVFRSFCTIKISINYNSAADFIGYCF